MYHMTDRNPAHQETEMISEIHRKPRVGQGCSGLGDTGLSDHGNKRKGQATLEANCHKPDLQSGKVGVGVGRRLNVLGPLTHKDRSITVSVGVYDVHELCIAGI